MPASRSIALCLLVWFIGVPLDAGRVRAGVAAAYRKLLAQNLMSVVNRPQMGWFPWDSSIDLSWYDIIDSRRVSMTERHQRSRMLL